MKILYWSPIVAMGSGTEYYLGQRERCESGEYLLVLSDVVGI